MGGGGGGGGGTCYEQGKQQIWSYEIKKKQFKVGFFYMIVFNDSKVSESRLKLFNQYNKFSFSHHVERNNNALRQI